jgi:translation initiation factor 4G
LNKITPEKFQPLSDDLLSLNLNSKKILLGVIHLIFEKALDEPKYSSMYAQLCRRISREGSTLEPEGDSRYTFETLLIRVCQDKFINRSQYSEKIINAPSQEDVDEEERRYIAKQKILGNVKFIGELFKLEMLNAATLHKMLEQLLDKKSRPYPNLDDRCEDMECLSQIFRTCGRQLDTDKSKNLIDQYFDNMEHKSNSSKYPPRIRFMLRDIIELRKDGWKPRKVARIEGPVPIQDLSTDEEYIRQQRDLRTRTMEYQNRNSDRNWMDKLPLSLQPINNYSGTLSMTSSSSLITGPPPNSYNSGNNYNSGGGREGRDSLTNYGGYRNNNNSNHHHHRNHDDRNGRPMNKYNNHNNLNDGGDRGGKGKYMKQQHNNMHHRQQHQRDDGRDGMGHNSHHHNNHQNSYNNNQMMNNNNMLGNKDLAPRFKRNLVTPTTANSVDDIQIQMRPQTNSLLFKASNINKPNPQQLPINQQANRSGNSSPGFSNNSSSANVDNLIPNFNNMQMNNANGKQQQQQQPAAPTPINANVTQEIAKPASPATHQIQPQSPQNNQQKDQQVAVTKQGSVEKPKAKKDKGPSRDEVLKKVAQFLNETLFDKEIMDQVEKVIFACLIKSFLITNFSRHALGSEYGRFS